MFFDIYPINSIFNNIEEMTNNMTRNINKVFDKQIDNSENSNHIQIVDKDGKYSSSSIMRSGNISLIRQSLENGKERVTLMQGKNIIFDKEIESDEKASIEKKIQSILSENITKKKKNISKEELISKIQNSDISQSNLNTIYKQIN